MTLSRRKLIAIGGLAVLAPVVAWRATVRPLATDRTPEGAYARIAKSVGEGDPAGFFAYLETEAQWACYTLRDMRKKARALVEKSYPSPQREDLSRSYAAFAEAPDGKDVFARIYGAREWSKRLRKDLSGVERVERDGERASVVTVRGTRWPFRRRDNGIWGITVFTAELLAEAEKSTRDLAVVTAAASDYDRVKSAP